ncbi:hypothetical protein [Micromonospora sp. NPDC050276]|uniref:hypothetical protein n=1 Tax=Micromonospora sp. NPDC050276 TaxID=3364278 RepID=UPI003795223A
MSQPTPAPPDEAVARQLGYARLLYDQAVTQSFAAPPLNFSSVLTFHDAMEFFYVLAVAQCGGHQSIDLNKPFVSNVKALRAVDGRAMSHPDAVDRVGRHRNAFKHSGAIPGPDAIAQTRRDATAFLEANCPRYFGMPFAEISMIQIVPQEQIRARLLAARKAAGEADIPAAMAELAIGFDTLITDWGKGKRLPSATTGSKSFDLSPLGTRRRRQFDRTSVRDSDTDRAINAVKREVLRTFEEVDAELDGMRHALRLQVAGIDTARYVRFAMIAPQVDMQFGGERYVIHMEGQYHYTPENYAFCESFVTDSALHLSRVEFSLWMPETYGDIARADEAAKDNNGVLPTGWLGERPGG